ncbi:MAG TPA: hypothetical protein VGG28_26835 [Kofleriaceae bacterium]|jgi:hypothetical protein
MIRKLSFIALLAAPATAAPVLDPALVPLQKLVGTWQGNDAEHHTTGGFTFEPDLGGKVLIRRSTNDGPKVHHEDVMIVFATPAGLRASYWDNEGHVINYAVAITGDRVEMLSDDVANQPRFKLTNDVHGDDDTIDFFMKPPGAAEFQHYVGGTVHRTKH